MQSELSAIEQISESNGIHVGIELIENGAIVYIDEAFTKDNFLKFKKIYLTKAQIFDIDHLPAKYMEWYDSVTQETVYYITSVEQYLQNLLSISREFIGPERGAALMEDITTRIAYKIKTAGNDKTDRKKIANQPKK
jgi:hypothetical protein